MECPRFVMGLLVVGLVAAQGCSSSDDLPPLGVDLTGLWLGSWSDGTTTGSMTLVLSRVNPDENLYDWVITLNETTCDGVIASDFGVNQIFPGGFTFLARLIDGSISGNYFFNGRISGDLINGDYEAQAQPGECMPGQSGSWTVAREN